APIVDQGPLRWGPRHGPHTPNVRRAPAKPWRSSTGRVKKGRLRRREGTTSQRRRWPFFIGLLPQQEADGADDRDADQGELERAARDATADAYAEPGAGGQRRDGEDGGEHDRARQKSHPPVTDQLDRVGEYDERVVGGEDRRRGQPQREQVEVQDHAARVRDHRGDAHHQPRGDAHGGGGGGPGSAGRRKVSASCATANRSATAPTVRASHAGGSSDSSHTRAITPSTELGSSNRSSEISHRRQ